MRKGNKMKVIEFLKQRGIMSATLQNDYVDYLDMIEASEKYEEEYDLYSQCFSLDAMLENPQYYHLREFIHRTNNREIKSGTFIKLFIDIYHSLARQYKYADIRFVLPFLLEYEETSYTATYNFAQDDDGHSMQMTFEDIERNSNLLKIVMVQYDSGLNELVYMAQNAVASKSQLLECQLHRLHCQYSIHDYFLNLLIKYHIEQQSEVSTNSLIKHFERDVIGFANDSTYGEYIKKYCYIAYENYKEHLPEKCKDILAPIVTMEILISC